MLFRSFFDVFFSMFCLFLLCLFYIFAFLCFVALCFVIDPYCQSDDCMPTKQSNAQHLVEYKKKIAPGRESKIRECHATAYALLRLWHKFEV